MPAKPAALLLAGLLLVVAVTVLADSVGADAGGRDHGQRRHYTEFFSPDEKVWCFQNRGSDYVYCATQYPQRLAYLHRNGKVDICDSADGGICIQNWGSKSPVLRHGDYTRSHGIRCASKKRGIRCLATRSGRGFLINKDKAVKVG